LIKRKDKIIANHNKIMKLKRENLSNRPLIEVFDSALDDEAQDFCFVCNL
jgi:hypothetical protein